MDVAARRLTQVDEDIPGDALTYADVAQGIQTRGFYRGTRRFQDNMVRRDRLAGKSPQASYDSVCFITYRNCNGYQPGHARSSIRKIWI